MRPRPASAVFFAVSVLILLLFSPTTNAHNITLILAKHPEFSTFNHYLTLTHLAADINRRFTITVLVVDNAGMADLLSKNLSIFAIRNVLSLHILIDYFGAKRLHQLTGGSQLTSTMFQASGFAPGTSGYVKIIDQKAGKVALGMEDGLLTTYFVKSVVEIPYNISVLQISQLLNSAEAEAPAADPNLKVTASLHKQGCTAFADLLIASGAIKWFEENVYGGLTVFCPSDKVVTTFAAKYKNLTAAGKVSLLLYHGIPVYQSLQMLKSNSGVMNTLATDGANKYHFTVRNEGEVVKLETKVVTATITGTLKDEMPLVVYMIDKILLPRELFKPVKAPKICRAYSVFSSLHFLCDCEAEDI